MRRSLIGLAVVVTVLVSVATPRMAAQSPRAAAVAPCTTATPQCTEWITIKGGPARSMVYTTYPLTKANAAITRALIMVHGTNRNADHYFDTAKAAAFLAGAINDTVVISPRIASADGSCKDTLAANEVSYTCGGDSWKSGGNAVSNKDISSFDFMDQILRTLADKKTFPNMTSIVVAGHSAGGQFANRYSMANKVHGTLGVNITYVVQLRVAGCRAGDAGRRCVAGECRGGVEDRGCAQGVHVWSRGRREMRELQPVARRL